MLFIKVENGKAVKIFNQFTEDESSVQSRWDWKSFEQVQKLAEDCSALTGKVYLAVDSGDHVSPRFDVIEAPAIGDLVSKAFNGDSYPEGEIVKITPTWQIKTSTGKTFRRVKNTSCWKDPNGYGLISGHHDERNPHI